MSKLVLATVMLIACSYRSDAAPRCLRAEQQDGTSGIRRFWFDADGKLVRNEDTDNRGVALTDTTITWTANGWTEKREAAKGGPSWAAGGSRGELGPHGELVRWEMGKQVVTLKWEGTFASAKPKPAHETAYLGAIDFWHSLHTADQHLFARSGKAFAFTGTVTYDDRKLAYEGGKLMRDGNTTYVWRGDDLVEIKHGDGRRSVVTSEKGRIRGTKLLGEGGAVEQQATVEYAGARPKLIVQRYFENGKEVYTTKLAITSCD
jgi:hypothetical protein